MILVTILEIGSTIGTLCAAGAAFIGLRIAKNQLNQIKEELKIAIANKRTDSLRIVLEIETQMNSRKLEFDKASREIREANLQNASDETIEILNDYFEAVKENYFNSLDRLCFCIRKEYLNDKDWKSEYQNLIHDIIVDFVEDFNEGSPYRNIKALNNKWQDE